LIPNDPTGALVSGATTPMMLPVPTVGALVGEKSLSRFVNPGGANPNPQPSNYQQYSDQDFVTGAVDNANPFRFLGPSTLDRTHPPSFGGTFSALEIPN